MKKMTFKCQAGQFSAKDTLVVFDDGSRNDTRPLLVFEASVSDDTAASVLLDAEQAQALAENLIKWAKKNGGAPLAEKMSGSL